MLTHHGLQVKEEKQAKKAKLASKTKLSFADDVEEEAVCWQTLLHIPCLLVCMSQISCIYQMRSHANTASTIASIISTNGQHCPTCSDQTMWQDCRTLCLSHVLCACSYSVHLRSQTMAAVHGSCVLIASAWA